MKQLQKNEKLVVLLRAAMGPDADLNDVAVFESISLNTLPINKAGSMFDGARVTPVTLREMADYTNLEKFVPLHTMHQQANELPVGRVFSAEIKQRSDGANVITDLHTLFYISKNSAQGQELIDKLDTGVLNEVSVGFRSKKMLCSKCDFDYKGPEANFMNFMDQECNKGHVIGEDDTHIKMDGLEYFLELSLVSRGAADHTQILDRQRAIIAQDDNLRSLAASSNVSNDFAFIFASKGKEPTMSIMTEKDRTALLTALKDRSKAAAEANFTAVTSLLDSVTDSTTYEEATALKAKFDEALVAFTKDQEEKTAALADAQEGMTTTLTLDAFVDLKADLKLANTKVSDLETEVTTLTASVAEKDAKIAELSTTAGTVETITAELQAATDFLKLSCQNLLVASGVDKPQIPDTVAELISTIKIAQGDLSKLPVGGVGLAANAGVGSEKKESKVSNSDAYKTKK